jgi:hypothetical protein
MNEEQTIFFNLYDIDNMIGMESPKVYAKKGLCPSCYCYWKTI